MTSIYSISTSEEMRKHLLPQLQWNLSNPYSETDVEHHFILRDAILNLAVEKGRMNETQFHQVQDFCVRFESQVVQFTIPGIGHTVAVAFEEITDAGAIEAINYLINKANSEQFYKRRFDVIGMRKFRNEKSGAPSLQRQSQATQQLTKDFKQARQTIVSEILAQTDDDAIQSRQKIVKRIEHAEFVVHRMQNNLRETIEAKTQTLEQLTQEVDQIAALTEEIRERESLLEQFENLDVYALTIALSAFPEGPFNYSDLEAASNFVQEKVSADLKAKLLKPFLLWKQKELKAAETEYIQDVVGLLHRTSRGDYEIYCKNQNMQPKRGGVEDLIMQAALLKETEFDMKTLARAPILTRMTPSLSVEVCEMLDYLDRRSDVFPEDTREYKGEPNDIAFQIDQRIYEDDWDAVVEVPERVQEPEVRASEGEAESLISRYSPILFGVAGAVYVAGRMGFEPARRISEVGLSALPLIVSAGSARALMSNWWASRDQLPYLLTGASVMVAPVMYALGTTDPTQIVQLAIENPQYAAAGLILAHRVTQAVHHCVYPEMESASGGLVQGERQFYLMSALGMGIATAFAVGGAMYAGEDATYFLAGAVDMVWDHYIATSVLSLLASHLANGIASKLSAPVVSAVHVTAGAVQTLASASMILHTASGIWNAVSGFASWAGASSGGSGPVVEEVIEDETLALPDGSDQGITYLINGEPVCRNPRVVPSPLESDTSLLGRVCRSAGHLVWDGTAYFVREVSNVYSLAKDGLVVSF